MSTKILHWEVENCEDCPMGDMYDDGRDCCELRCTHPAAPHRGQLITNFYWDTEEESENDIKEAMKNCPLPDKKPHK